MNPNTPLFIKLLKHPFKFKFFLFTKLPSAYIAGVRVREASEKKCVASVPYKWLSQNPFRSTYFACLSMAAELSTGALAMAHLYKIDPPVSMLVVKVDSEYLKKATGRLHSCLYHRIRQNRFAPGRVQKKKCKGTGSKR